VTSIAVRSHKGIEELCLRGCIYFLYERARQRANMGLLAVMTSRTMEDPRSRYVAFAAVVLLHLVLLHLAQRMSGTAHRIQREVDDALVWLRLDRPAEPKSVEPPRTESSPQEQVRAQDPEPIRDEPSEQAHVPTTPLPPRQVDWRGNAALSAERIVGAAGEQRYRSFGPRKDAPPGERQPASPFGEPPKHKYGDIGEVGGDPVVWMNDNCYTELDKRVQTARDWALANPGQFAPPQIKCVGSGGAAADGKLFDHIKKREEPPVPKAGTEMNELPERRDEAPGTTR
jgi:hypothetical protein